MKTNTLHFSPDEMKCILSALKDMDPARANNKEVLEELIDLFEYIEDLRTNVVKKR